MQLLGAQEGTRHVQCPVVGALQVVPEDVSSRVLVQIIPAKRHFRFLHALPDHEGEDLVLDDALRGEFLEHHVRLRALVTRTEPHDAVGLESVESGGGNSRQHGHVVRALGGRQTHTVLRLVPPDASRAVLARYLCKLTVTRIGSLSNNLNVVDSV